MIRELGVGLTRLSFDDNFESFEVDVTIEATSELEIRNQLRDAIPSKRVVIAGGTGAGDIVDGDTEWTTNFVYLKNTSASPVTATVLFFK